MSMSQTIEKPFGISVFGSALVRAEPDRASLRFAVSSLAQHPKEAFDKTRTVARGVRELLAQLALQDMGVSRINLSQTFRYTSGENRFVGYTAKTSFHVLLHDLERVEEVLVKIVDVGVNEVGSVEFLTSRLRELRMEARRRAIGAAREKAEIYCTAAGVTLGPTIHIEDLNPDMGQLKERGHMQAAEPTLGDEEALSAFNPGSIEVAAAVQVAYELGR
jgi:uncharacterized protein